ncbi:MAG TPA: carboxypeptidase regulatory-like domain-containing protein [Acidisarcina sp.]|nr:carboxypeptidase regulatory-like domain-containing protein [Acidisarcina sp.]
MRSVFTAKSSYAFCRSALFALATALLLAPGNLPAQSTQGSILGTVRDTAGAVVPRATIILKNLDEGSIRTTISNSIGDYQFVDVKAGHYTEEVSSGGFQKWSVTGLVLAVRQQLHLDASLTVGSVQQEVQVSGDTVSTIDTETPSISAVYSNADVSNLPVNTRASAAGTSALNIVGTLPGVQADHGDFALQGGLPFQTEVSVDGITIQSSTGNSPISDAFPSSESISELRADGAQNNAEFGQPGEITVTTKGGGNTIHGSAFWYHQNAAFNAIPYTNPVTTKKPKLIGNTYGASFGGPVVIPHFYNGHNKTFIYGAYEGWRHPAQTTEAFTVPSTLMKQGNFSKYSSAGFTGLTNPFTGGSYGKSLPSINPAAQKLLSFYPDPNVGDPTAYVDDGTANYIANKDSSGHSDQFDIRGDQYFGANQKFLLWGRFTWKNFPISQPQALTVPSAQNANQSRVLKISANWTITPQIINEAGFGFTLFSSGQTDSFDGKAFTEGLGLNGLQNLFYNGIPELDFNNISALNADRLTSINKSRTFVYTDALTWSKGNHIFKFGLDIRTLEAVTPLGFNGSDNYGTFQYNTQGSAGLFTGVDFADFLSGLPYQTFYDAVQQDNDGSSVHYHFFGQDQWKVTPNLTLSYGVRYELHPGYSDKGGDIGNFDDSLALAGRAIYPNGKSRLLAQSFLASANACDPDGVNYTNSAVVNGAPCMPVLGNSQAGYPGGLKKYPHLRFMPRFGFAWRPFNNNKTAVRGGFGMYNITLLGANFYSLTGTLQAQTTQYTNTLDSTSHKVGYQWPNIYAGAGNGGCSNCYGQDYFGTANSTNWKDPYTEQWSFSVDHDFGSGYAARLSYIASETHQLVWAPDENTLPFSSTISANNQPLSARRFPNWGRINNRATGANASYQSLQAEFDHRFQRGLQLNSTWTYAKALADNQGPANTGFAGESGGARATSILDRAADYGNVYGTRRHRWNTTAVYDLPFGRGREFGSGMSRMADSVVGGWRLSTIFLWQTGPFESPYFPSGQGDPSGTGSGLKGTASGFDGGHRNQYPDVVPGASYKPLHRTRTQWVNPNAFTCPGYPGWTPGTACTTGSGSGPVPNPIGRFGNARVGSVVGPGMVNLSAGLSKTFSITEGLKLKAEGTFTNVLNHTNLSDPNMNVSSRSFGLITSAVGSDFGGARSGQVSMRLDF